jgi:predicted alpha/beta-hydrolase family hydrolase
MGGAEYLGRCAAPKVFVQSTHDQYGPRAELEAAFAGWAAPKRIIWIEAADHFFAGGLEALEKQVAAVAAEL